MEDDTAALAAQAASLGKVLRKLHMVLAQRCGLAEHAQRQRHEAVIETAVEEMASACAELLGTVVPGAGRAAAAAAGAGAPGGSAPALPTEIERLARVEIS